MHSIVRIKMYTLWIHSITAAITRRWINYLAITLCRVPATHTTDYSDVTLKKWSELDNKSTELGSFRPAIGPAFGSSQQFESLPIWTSTCPLPHQFLRPFFPRLVSCTVQFSSIDICIAHPPMSLIMRYSTSVSIYKIKMFLAGV